MDSSFSAPTIALMVWLTQLCELASLMSPSTDFPPFLTNASEKKKLYDSSIEKAK